MKRQPNARGAGDALREQLVAAASELLLAPQQIALPSLRAVARSCNVSPAAVYLHFDSQLALIEAVIDAQLGRMREYVDSTLGGGSPREQLVQFGMSYADWAFAHPGAYQLLFESADRLGVEHEEDEAADRWYLLARGAGLLAAANPAIDVKPASVRLWVALHGIVSLRLHKPHYEWPPLGGEIERLIDAEVDYRSASSIA